MQKNTLLVFLIGCLITSISDGRIDKSRPSGNLSQRIPLKYGTQKRNSAEVSQTMRKGTGKRAHGKNG